MHSVLLYSKLNLASYKQANLTTNIAQLLNKISCLPLACSFTFYVASGNMDSSLQRLKARLQECDWLDEGKNIRVSQSEAE